MAMEQRLDKMESKIDGTMERIEKLGGFRAANEGKQHQGGPIDQGTSGNFCARNEAKHGAIQPKQR